ncbi:MAG: GNAT family N-acetyltransferase [Chloroflexi bacterium]|nr:GNAT family N-acetyltransferase [Chloroflexota bacterium]
MIASQKEITLRTATGLELRARPIAHGDEPLLLDIFSHLSSESRYLRFHEPLDNASPELIEQVAKEIVESSVNRGFGLLAFADLPDQANAPIGGARYVKVSDGVAEVAITIRDDMQKCGIGRALLLELVRQARKEGISKLIAVVQAQNQAVLRLLRESPYPIKRSIRGGELFIEADIREKQEEAES